MASGLGPNFILPWAGDIGTDIGGYRPGPDTQQPYNPAWGATPPIDTSGRTWQLGTGGNFVSRGPQSTQWDPNAQWSQISTPAGATGALFGDSYAPGFGQGAYGRFQDAGNSYTRRYATDVKDAQGNTVLMSPERTAGLRSAQQYGGRDPYGNAMTGSNYGTHQDFSNFAANQQGANQFLNNPLIQSLMAQQQEQGSPFARADPQAYMGLAAQNEGRFPSTGDVANSYIGQAGQLGNRYVGQAGDISGQYTNQAGMLGYGGVGQVYGAGDKGIYNMAGTLGGMRQAGMNEIGGLTNQYEDQLMQQMTQQGQKDLSQGMQDTTSSMAALGLGRSGQAQSTAGGMWNDIQQRNSLQRQQLQSQFAESALGRQTDIMGQLRGTEMQNVGSAIGAQQQGAINAALAAQGGQISSTLAGQQGSLNALLAGQQGGLNAILAAQGLAGQGNESRLQRGYGAGMSGMDALTGSLEGSRAAQRAALGQGYGTTAGWNQNMQGNYLNSLQGADASALARMQAESQGQSLGLHDYMGLQNTKDAMYNDRMNAMLGLEDRYTTGQNAVLNQMAQYGMMPQDWRMQMVTGISPTGTSQARTSPWGPAIASAGIQAGGSYLGGMNQTPNPGYYGPGQNGGFLLG